MTVVTVPPCKEYTIIVAGDDLLKFVATAQATGESAGAAGQLSKSQMVSSWPW